MVQFLEKQKMLSNYSIHVEFTYAKPIYTNTLMNGQ